MLLIHEDKTKRVIKGKEDIKFSSSSVLHLIILTGRAKSEKQISKSSTDDEELTIQIDGKIFPKLGSDSNRVLDSPASINGGKSHNLSKTVYILTNLSGKEHKIVLTADNPPGSAIFGSLQVYSLDSVDTLTLEPKLQAEDGDRREWITFVLDKFLLNSFTVELNLKRRFIDSDDVKVIVDGDIKKNDRSILHKLWYFIASIFTGENQTETFHVNLSIGLHYIELWADRMPTLRRVIFTGLAFEEQDSIEDKIRKKAREFGLDPELMVRVAIVESNLDPLATSPVGAKGIFQLMDITIEQIAKLGYKITDPYDPNQNITGGIMYFKWLYEMYEGDKEQLEKTLAAWNWGPSNVSKNEPLDYESLPEETRRFINKVLGK